MAKTPRWRAFGAVVVGVVLSATSATAHVPACVLDQQQASFGGIGGGYIAVSHEQIVAATFTAGVSGSLCRVAVHIGSAAYGCGGGPLAPGALLVEVRSTEVGTAWVFGGNYGQTTTLIPADAVLARETVAASAVPSQAGWLEIAFARPARVLAGERYALVLTAEYVPPDCSCGHPDGAAYAWTEARGPNGSDLYPGGQMFAMQRTGDRWSVDDYPAYPVYADLLFETHVIGPDGCGNGAVDAAEQCDDGNLVDGDCCSHDCAFEPPSTLCRASAGACDAPERCTGIDAICPPDAKRTDVCRPASGPCDRPETCDGSADDCPADFYEASGVGCRSAVGGCELIGICNGSGPQCPADVCTAGPADSDGDGELDRTDQCPATAPATPVDDAGCSHAQFCAAFDAASGAGAKACRKADWRNDEPVMRARQADCTPRRPASGVGDRECAPVGAP